MNAEQPAPTVAVRGEASIEVEPEIAVLSVEATGRDRDKTAALTELAQRQRALTELLEPFAAAIERTERGQISVYATYAPQRQDVPDVWIASARTTVTIGDLPAVPEIVRAVGALEALALSGPAWAVRPDSPVHRQTRIAAVDDALRRAADYAGAVGSEVTGLLEIADVGLSGGPGPLRAMPMALMARAAAEPIELDLEPQLQTVHASIDVRVAISSPTAPLKPAD